MLSTVQKFRVSMFKKYLRFWRRHTSDVMSSRKFRLSSLATFWGHNRGLWAGEKNGGELQNINDCIKRNFVISIPARANYQYDDLDKHFYFCVRLQI